eukprot:m.195040 g.195040  ORF g.195040 m.195040 type:complete len:260 (+) comp25031_c0_seq1:1838-2617(+)
MSQEVPDEGRQELDGEGEAVVPVEPVLAEAKKPMYSVVMDMTGAGGHKALVHQLVVVSTLGEVAASTPSGKTDLGDMYKRLFEELQEGRQWVSFSGMLLVYQKYCLQVIESPPDMIREVAAAIARMNADGILGTTKILYSHDIPTPMFPAFEYRVLTTASHIEFKTTESADMVVAEYIATLSQLADFVSTHGPDLCTALDQVQQEAPHLLGTQGMLEYFTRVVELDSVTEFTDRLNMYLNVKMDDDVVWPHPQRLYPYD